MCVHIFACTGVDNEARLVSWAHPHPLLGGLQPQHADARLPAAAAEVGDPVRVQGGAEEVGVRVPRPRQSV